jgi:hypothetical protein
LEELPSFWALPEEDTTTTTKMLASRPIVRGGSGYSKVPDGELVIIGKSSEAFTGLNGEFTTALKVVEVPTEGLVEQIAQALITQRQIDHENALSQAASQVKQLSLIAGQHPVGTRLYVKPGLKIHVLLRA